MLIHVPKIVLSSKTTDALICRCETYACCSVWELSQEAYYFVKKPCFKYEQRCVRDDQSYLCSPLLSLRHVYNTSRSHFEAMSMVFQYLINFFEDFFQSHLLSLQKQGPKTLCHECLRVDVNRFRHEKREKGSIGTYKHHVRSNGYMWHTVYMSKHLPFISAQTVKERLRKGKVPGMVR